MSFAGEIRRAVMASPRMKLPEIRSAMHKAFTAEQITEAETEELDALINAKAAIPAPEKPVQRRAGSRPRPLHPWKDAAPGPLQADCRPHWPRGSPWQSKLFLP